MAVIKKPEIKKPDTFLNTLIALMRLSLVLLGLVGIAYEVFREGGLLKWIFQTFFTSLGGLGAAIVIAFLLYRFFAWVNSVPPDQTSRRGDIPMYLMMAVGAYYLYRLLSTGGL